MTASPNRAYLAELDQLRGAACLLVFAYHGFQLIGARLAHGLQFDPMQHWIIARNPLVAFVEEGHSGVGLFIVLSGFVLSLGTIGRVIPYRTFLLSRVLRIYPVLIVCVVASVSARPIGLVGLIATLLPLHTMDTVNAPLTAMVWAVNVEFLCHLAFPFLIRPSATHGTRFLFQIVALTLVMRGLAVFGEGANPRDISYWTILGRLDQFCIGMIAARAYLLHGWRERMPAWAVYPVGLGVIASLALFNHLGGWPLVSTWKLLWPTIEGGLWALFLLCYIRASQGLRREVAAPLVWLGVISYPLYMIHFAVLAGCIDNQIYLRVSGNPYADALLTTGFIALPIALAIAVLLRACVEVPFLSLRPRYVQPGLDSRPAPVTSKAAALG